jgi:two-component system phosphate regulon response regulator PhoB
MLKVFVVDDESAIRETVGMVLSRAGFESAEAADVAQATALMAQYQPDLILLDWMLPGLSGLHYLKMLKGDARTCEIPVILLTGRGSEEDKVSGLDCGADDFVTKPFSTKELLARIRAVLRRSDPVLGGTLVKAGKLELDSRDHRVHVGSEPVKLGPIEFRLLNFFMTHPNRVYSREQLLNLVWNGKGFVGERTVDVHIRYLRKALSPWGYNRLIQTVRGAGYRFSHAGAT